ncbi:MAG: hypothetical protein ABIL09_09940, partial [Gemmatimonadota bacterium]
MGSTPKSTLPLVLGGLLLVAAAAGYVYTSLGGGEQAPARPAPASQVEPASPQPAASPATEVRPGPTDAEVAAQDEKDVVRIILAQIAATPKEIDEAFLLDLFRFVRDRQAMDDYLNRVLADGARFKAVYDAEKARKKQAPSRNPNAYVFEARDL